MFIQKMAEELLDSYLELLLSSERSYLMFLSGLSAAEISGAWAESKTSSDIDKRSGGWPRSKLSLCALCLSFFLNSFLFLFLPTFSIFSPLPALPSPLLS